MCNCFKKKYHWVNKQKFWLNCPGVLHHILLEDNLGIASFLQLNYSIVIWQCSVQSVSEWVNSGLTSHQQRGHTETGPRFKVSSGEAGDRSCDPWIGSPARYPLHHRRSFSSVRPSIYQFNEITSLTVFIGGDGTVFHLPKVTWVLILYTSAVFGSNLSSGGFRFLTINRDSSQTAFHYNPPIVLKWHLEN